jgi:uncharacterized protein YbjT (DUF2867 family)
MSAKKVVVAGATGYLGGKIVNELMKQGADVTAMVRASSNRSNLEKMGVKNFVTGDMMNKGSLKEALSPEHGFDAIVASAAGYTKHSKGDSNETDTIGYKNLVDATREAGIPRFVLISILECCNAVTVPHFYNKYLIEQYLREKRQPYVALRAGAFLDQMPDFILPKLARGILPVFFEGVDYGTIYTSDLARYTAMAAISLPDNELNTYIDVGLSTPVNSNTLAIAFSKILNKPITPKPAFPAIATKVIIPIAAKFSSFVSDMYEMVKWVNTGVYVSKDTSRQQKLFGDLPTIEEAVRRYAKDKKLIA